MRRDQVQVLVILVLSLLAPPRAALADKGGGGLTGNGGSLSEQNIALAYEQLPKVINSCLHSGTCDLTDEDRSLLSRIREIALMNVGRKDKFDYKSEKRNPGTFDTGENEPHRISKTGFFPGAVIEFNTDLLSGPEGDRSMSVSEAAGMLVHELGHQAEVRDHKYLDQLGAKIRIRISAIWTRLELPQLDPKEDPALSIETFNYVAMDQAPEILVNLETESVPKVIRLGESVSGQTACPEPGMIRLGYSVTNGHWLWPAKTPAGVLARFHAWVNLHCLRPREGAVTTFHLDLTVLARLLRKDGAAWEIEKVTSSATRNSVGAR